MGVRQEQAKSREIDLPSNATGAPMTYMAGGKQYIVFPVGGGPVPEELIAVGSLDRSGKP